MERVIAELETGKPLSAICREPGMPCRQTIRDWCEENKELGVRVARARLLGEESILEETIEIADDLTEDPASRKVRVWARLEALKRFNPKRYGDQPAAPVNVAVAVNVMTPEHLADLAARKRASIERRRRSENLITEATPSLSDSAQSETSSGGPMS